MESIKFCIEYLTNIVFNSGSIDSILLENITKAKQEIEALDNRKINRIEAAERKQTAIKD